MLKNVIEAKRAARAQDADCARINGAIRLAEQDIEALERQLYPNEMGKNWSEIRDRTIFMIRDVRQNMLKRAHEAKATETWLLESPVACADCRELSELLSRIYRSAEEMDARIASVLNGQLSGRRVTVKREHSP
jgi:hypothetical protein